MKKTSLLVVVLLTTLFSYSQDIDRIIRASKIQYINGKFVVLNTQYPTDLFVILKDWDIIIGTYKLKTYDNPQKTMYDDHFTYTWKCVDSEGKKCLFMMKKFKPEVTNHILYDVLYEQNEQNGIMYEYETE